MATLTSPSLGKLIFNVRNLLNSPNSANSFWTDAELTEYLNEAVRMYFLEATMSNEGLFTVKTSLNIANGVETIALPSDCFVIKALRKKVTNGFQILDYMNDLTNSYTTQGGNSSEGYFPYYFFRGNDLVLRPPPEFAETAGLELEYLQFPDVMVQAGDLLTAQLSPIFKQLLEMYAVYKAKLKESLVNGVMMHKVASDNLSDIYSSFKETLNRRSKNPTHVIPFNPESG